MEIVQHSDLTTLNNFSVRDPDTGLGGAITVSERAITIQGADSDAFRAHCHKAAQAVAAHIGKSVTGHTFGGSVCRSENPGGTLRATFYLS